MKGSQKFFICEKCKNLVGLIEDHRAPLLCCGSEMLALVPNTVEASGEKHLPEVAFSGDTLNVQVGSILHPMEETHHITFIYVETEKGGQRKALQIGEEPKASFCFTDDKPIAVYEYCNLHGLWKTEID